MNRVRKFLRLRSAERSLLIQAAVLLALIRLGFLLLPFDRLRRWLSRWERPAKSAPEADPEMVESIVHAVKVAAKYVPRTRTCLMQALVARILMSRRGLPAQLHLGVARGDGGELKAHAWIEYEGVVVIGDSENLSAYTPLPPLE